jgi:hypothetical protein
VVQPLILSRLFLKNRLSLRQDVLIEKSANKRNNKLITINAFQYAKKRWMIIWSSGLLKNSNVRARRTRHFFQNHSRNFFFIVMNRKSLVAIKSVRWSPQVLVVFIWNNPVIFFYFFRFFQQYSNRWRYSAVTERFKKSTYEGNTNYAEKTYCAKRIRMIFCNLFRIHRTNKQFVFHFS